MSESLSEVRANPADTSETVLQADKTRAWALRQEPTRHDQRAEKSLGGWLRE